MTDRLSFWIAAAAVILVAAAIAMTGLLWTGVLALINLPMVLAVMLLGRATWRALHGRPWALRVGSRELLAGAAGFALPLLFLGVWTVARESGVVGARLTSTQTGSKRTTMFQPWTVEPAQPLLPDPGLVVHAPDGVLGAAFAAGLQGRWPAPLATLHGDVTLACDPPCSPWPLYKSADLTAKVTVAMQLHPLDPATPVRCSSLTMDLETTWTMMGLASRRDFQAWIGGELAQFVRKAIDDNLKKAQKGN